MLKIPQKTEYVIKKLCQNGYEAYIVGGCVRDMLMGLTPHDFDITTSATPEQVQNLFEKTVPTGIKHGTVTVIIENTPIEVTTFRTESGYSNHRSPDEVQFVKNLKEDLSRRDFTVNAMAYNSIKGLQDYFKGTEDLNAKILRAVGNPKLRFNEDALRILRLFRFASVLDFSIEDDTLNAALSCADELRFISQERIFSELFKAVSGKNIKVISPLIETGGLEFLKITHSPSFEKLSKLQGKENLAFFSFLYLSGTDVLEALKQLKVSNDLKEYSSKLLNLISLPLPKSKAKIKKNLTSFEIYKDYLKFREAVFNDDISLCLKMLNEIAENNEPYLISHLKINGNYFLNQGFSGEKIGKILKQLLNIVIENPELNKREILIKESEKLA